MKDTVLKILKTMDNINYGFTDIDGNIYEPNKKNYREVFPTRYRLKRNDELLKTNYGVCWDQVELERYLLESDGIECSSYGIVCYDDNLDPTHTFIVVNDDKKYYWVDHAWQIYSGISEYDTLLELLQDVKCKFKAMLKEDNVFSDSIFMYQYDKPEESYDCMEFYHYLENSKLIKLNEEIDFYCMLNNDKEYIEFYKYPINVINRNDWYKVNLIDEEVKKTIKDIDYGEGLMINDFKYLSYEEYMNNIRIVKVMFIDKKIPVRFFRKVDGNER